MHSRPGFAKFGVTILGASAALALGALPASADEAEGHVDGGEHGYNVNLGDGYRNMSTELFNLGLAGGSSLQAYCVEIDVNLDPKRGLVEKPWDEFPNDASPFDDNRDKINWVLQNGYPVLDTAELEQRLAGDDAPVTFDSGLDEREAVAATQAAVWHYSDGKDLDREHPISSHGADDSAAADVVALYDYLTGEANTGIGDQPKPALEVSPDGAAGTAGEKLGPFTVSTTGEITDLKTELPDGVKITDADGKELTVAELADGARFFVDVPAEAAEGNGSFELTASAHVATGRLFVADDYAEKPAQSLIVASSEDTTLAGGGSVSWEAAPETTVPPTETPSSEAPAPAPSSEVAPPAPTETSVKPQADSGDLAETGVSIMTPIIIGAVLLGAGIGALLLQRRRKNA